MLEILCLSALVVVLFLDFIFLFSEKKVSPSVGGQSLFFLALIVVVFSFIFEPRDFVRWDLIEHFKVVDAMRENGITYVLEESKYVDLFVYNFFAYFISLLPKSLQNLLTIIPLILDFIIAGFIYKKLFKKYFSDTNGKVRVLTIIIWFFTFGVQLAVSGIRCSLAVSLSVLAVFLEYIEKEHKGFAIFLYIVAVFVHSFAWIIVLIRLFAKVKHKYWVVIFSLGFSLGLEPVAKFVVERTSSNYIKYSFERILDTIENMGFVTAITTFARSTLAIYFCFFLLAVYLCVISIKAGRRCKENDQYKDITNFVSVIGLVAIGLSFNYLYLERFMYLMSYAFMMIIPMHNQEKKGINTENIIVLPISLFLFLFHDIYLFLVNYVGYYFIRL